MAYPFGSKKSPNDTPPPTFRSSPPLHANPMAPGHQVVDYGVQSYELSICVQSGGTRVVGQLVCHQPVHRSGQGR